MSLINKQKWPRDYSIANAYRLDTVENSARMHQSQDLGPTGWELGVPYYFLSLRFIFLLLLEGFQDPQDCEVDR